MDIICFKPRLEEPKEVFIAEVKVRATVDALGQVLRYVSLCKKLFPQARIRATAIVTKEIDHATGELADHNNVQVWLWDEKKRDFILYEGAKRSI